MSLELNDDGLVSIDPETLETSLRGTFAGGSLVWGDEDNSPILSISHGRRAAISIDRYSQKVSLTASRENEGPYDTRLYTATAGVRARSRSPHDGRKRWIFCGGSGSRVKTMSPMRVHGMRQRFVNSFVHSKVIQRNTSDRFTIISR